MCTICTRVTFHLRQSEMYLVVQSNQTCVRHDICRRPWSNTMSKNRREKSQTKQSKIIKLVFKYMFVIDLVPRTRNCQGQEFAYLYIYS